MRFTRVLIALALAAACALALSACGGGAAEEEPEMLDGPGSVAPARVVVGTLATEDILPLWVAQDEGLFADTGVEVEVVTFQSATELIAGVTSGEVDLAMTDIMVTASMFAGGTDVQMLWVTLGTTPEQGRFGIMVGPDSNVQSLADLAGQPIGVGSNTILEYVMDQLMAQAGVPSDQVVVEELQKLPVRYQMMAEGEVAAAALPGSLLALGEANGCRVVADDTQGANLSTSVMIARADALGDDALGPFIPALEQVWDKAAELINANPEAYRDVLVANANLSDAVAGTYPISQYPTCQLPTSEMVDPVLAWMQDKGYLAQPLAYDATTGRFSAK